MNLSDEHYTGPTTLSNRLDIVPIQYNRVLKSSMSLKK